ncbi:hypothetical protein RRG08_034730 [Elysia crispata]|uniref:Uncharacterized protein n=1 Tax=Elysia crispata TaxID=231223 RepID=A0AAE0Y3N1_9GAST|nr:hypothetical protein RRG08_034730 [Elysia crispata]
MGLVPGYTDFHFNALSTEQFDTPKRRRASNQKHLFDGRAVRRVTAPRLFLADQASVEMELLNMMTVFYWDLQLDD